MTNLNMTFRNTIQWIINSLKFLLALIILVISSTIYTFAIDLNIPKTDSEWDKAVMSLNWTEGPKKMKFIDANSTIKFDDNFLILENKDANQYLYWANGIQFPDIKLFGVSRDDGSQYMFSYVDSGYVKTDDWTKVDPNKFIKEIRKNYKDSNTQRKNNGMPTILDVQWKKTPYLDGNYSSVYYALEISWSDNQRTTQGTAILLGREGYTEANYIAGDSGYQERMLTSLSVIHKFNSTKEYKDWKAGDKVAAAGIGALLASTLGLKALKPGLVASGLLLLKKFWFILLLPFIWIGKLFTKSEKKSKRRK